MKNSFKMFITGMWMCTLSLPPFFSLANNIRINGAVQVSQGTGDTLVLSFPLRWDNSWRDQFNWDAAWVFLKYKSGTGGWSHINLCTGGHRLVNSSGQPVPFSYMPGNTGSSTVGLFIYRTTAEAGNTPEINCQVKCLKSSLGGLTPEQFQKHEGFVLAQAMEMVYVPYGAYYLGDGACASRLAASDESPALIDSEDAITASTATKVYPVTNNRVGSALSIAANYPKGYKGFYMMKYEVSQEQWVYFLNTLTYPQQQERVSGLADLKEGEYIFGNKTTPINRNGIIVTDGNSPVIFTNNLNHNNVYSEDGDGKTIACNYLSPSDMIAYCSWAGLRPMSEMEYEKACRSSYPEQPVREEYAWHDNVITGKLSTVSNEGKRNERSDTPNANVNAGNNFGPVRNGIFATGSSTQQSAGATFWGGMDMSGNLKELCYNLTYTGFDGSTTGAGVYNTALWSGTPAYFGVRGGGFNSADSLLRVSDRTEITGYFADINRRDSTVGFRAVRSVGSDVTVTQGKLLAKQAGAAINGSACPGVLLELSADVPAKAMSGSSSVPNMDFTYAWYVLKPGATADSIIPGANQAALSYNNLNVTGTSASVTYKFRRKAICPVGESMTDYISFTVPNLNVMLSPAEVNIDACDNSTTVTAKGYCSSPVFTWKYGDKILKTGTTYLPSRTDFNGSGNFTVDVAVSSGGCTSDKQGLKVYIPNIQELASNLVTIDNCGKVIAIDGRDSKHYCTVKVSTQCWMGKDLNVGTYQITNSSDFWKFDEDGIQKWCYGNDEASCTIYGGLYEWWEAVCGGKCKDNLTTTNALNLTLTSEYQLIEYGAKMVSGSTTQVQGICPDGWHIPSDEDWITLEMQLGMSRSQANGVLWRGTDQGTQMKMPGTFNGNNWCSGATCNSSGMGMLPMGLRVRNGQDFSHFGIQGSWWSSTPHSHNAAWSRYMLPGEARVNRDIGGYRDYGVSVRCVKN